MFPLQCAAEHSLELPNRHCHELPTSLQLAKLAELHGLAFVLTFVLIRIRSVFSSEALMATAAAGAS